MANSQRFKEAFRLFDEANSNDPNTELFQGKEYPKELLYALRMTDKLSQFAPGASEDLQLTARCQHICRWEIPRESYAMNRTGYLKWRQDLKIFHARKAIEILKKVGYEKELLDQVEFLLLKKQLKKNKETQTLEDVICLVFLEHYFEPFIEKHEEDKLVGIIQKTWNKMSEAGRKSALQLPLSHKSQELVKMAIAI